MQHNGGSTRIYNDDLICFQMTHSVRKESTGSDSPMQMGSGPVLFIDDDGLVFTSLSTLFKACPDDGDNERLCAMKHCTVMS